MTAASTRRKRRSSSGTRSQRAQKRATSKQASKASKSPMGATESKAQEADAREGAQGSRASKPSQGLASATRAIQKELNKLRKLQGGENGASSLPAGGFEVELADEEDLYTWRIKLRPSLFTGSPLEQDLRNAAREQKVAEIPVLLEIRFPGDFPRAPPFIRVVSPRFAFHTGHVTIGGSICTEFLTASGWTASYPLENVLVQIIAEMMEGGGRLDRYNRGREYSEYEAKAAFTRVARDHGWRV